MLENPNIRIKSEFLAALCMSLLSHVIQTLICCAKTAWMKHLNSIYILLFSQQISTKQPYPHAARAWVLASERACTRTYFELAYA